MGGDAALGHDVRLLGPGPFRGSDVPQNVGLPVSTRAQHVVRPLPVKRSAVEAAKQWNIA